MCPLSFSREEGERDMSLTYSCVQELVNISGLNGSVVRVPVHLLYANIPAESLSYAPTFFLKGRRGERDMWLTYPCV